MRIRLLVDVETDDIARLQRHVADQPLVHMRIEQGAVAQDDHVMVGRFVGAKEAFDAVAEAAQT